MQQKPDVTPRTSHGIAAEIISVPPIAKSRGLALDETPMRMDPRVLNRIHDVVSVLQQDYTAVLAKQALELTRALGELTNDVETSIQRIYAIAHEIRGIAGTFARPLAGQVAAYICEFIDGHTSRAQVDAITLQDHVDTLVQIATLTPEPEGLCASVILTRLDEATRDQSTAYSSLNTNLKR